MNCFDTHYYALNRKLLRVVGQWPYQSFADKVKRRSLYLCVLASGVTTLVARGVTAEVDFDMFIEFLSNYLTVTLTAIRCFLFAFNNAKVVELLDSMNLNWQSLNDQDEYDIFAGVAEEGRLYVSYFALIISSAFSIAALFVISPPLLKCMNLINGSYPRVLLYPAEYFVDEEKYYYLIIVHMTMVSMVVVVGVLASDTFFMVFMYHTVGIFKITCHRLEHIFDNYNVEISNASDRKTVCERIASAVECHRRAIRFCERIVTAIEWPNLISLLLVLVNVTVSFYWAVMSRGQGFKMLFGLTIGVGEMALMFSLDVVAQKIADSSVEVIDKAYSSSWYKADVKHQTLLLLTMQRGLRPSFMLLGRIYPMTLENYATEVKASFSYFTVLMSLK